MMGTHLIKTDNSEITEMYVNDGFVYGWLARHPTNSKDRLKYIVKPAPHNKM